MVDWGVIFGGAALVASLATLLYSSQQVKVARRQADEAARTSLLASSHEMLARYQSLRTRWLTHPKGLEGLKHTLPGLSDAVDAAGGMDLYLLYRDMLDTFQDVYFLRQEGVVPESHWHVWTRNHMRSPLRAPGYEGTGSRRSAGFSTRISCGSTTRSFPGRSRRTPETLKARSRVPSFGPMALKDVKPTRSQLIELKKRIVLSKKGYKLLKMKRDGLIMEFFKMLEDAKKVRASVSENYQKGERAVHVAEAVEGAMPIRSAAQALVKSPTIATGKKNVMGVVVPTIQGQQIRTPLLERGYGIIGTSPRIDEAANRYEALVETIVKAAEIETSIKKMLDEIEKTKRRVNALEYKVIPELEQARDFIRLRLEEMERESTFRLKKVKGKNEANEKEAAAERARAHAA